MTKYDPLWAQSGSYNGREDRTLITHLWDEGVMDLTAFKVSERGAGANFTVDITAGTAVVTGDIDADQGNYLCRETAATTGTVVTSVPTAGNERYDRVILEVRDNTEDGGGATDWRFRVVAGTPASVGTASAPALPSHAITLAVIGPIVNSTTAITNSMIADGRTLAGRRCTPGTIEHLAAAHVPTGWLSCDGSAVSRTSYARLFAHIGTAFGVGNGSTTFNLPDLRGKVAVPVKAGQSQVDTIGETGGEYTHTMTTSEMVAHDHGGVTGAPSVDHTHSVNIAETQLKSDGVDVTVGQIYSVPDDGTNSIYRTIGIGTGGAELTVDPAATQSAGQSVNHTHSVTSQGSGTAFNVMQPYQVVALAVIRT